MIFLWTGCGERLSGAEKTHLEREQRFNGQIQALLSAPELVGARHGIHVIDLSGQQIYARNERELFRPASLLKLFTAAAAIEMLGPDYRWETKLTADTTELKAGVIRNLTIVPSADPFLTKAQHNMWAKELRQRGIDTIEASLAVDHSDFPPPHVPAAWEQGDIRKDFARAPTPFIIIDSDKDPLTLFKKALKEEGIEFILATGASSKAAQKELVVHESAPLSKLLPRLLEESENLGSELLLRTMAHEKRGQGSYAQGTRLLQKWIQDIWIGRDEINSDPGAGKPLVADGSGLAWRNLVTPGHVTSLLQKMAESEHAEPFFGAIPVAGEDGTLKFRMRSGPLHVRVRAKTGYLPHTRTLAGTMTTAGGQRVAFAIMSENYRVPTARINALHENILKIIYKIDSP